MKKLSIYGITNTDQQEPQLLAEVKLHPTMAPDQNSRQRIMEEFKEKGALVLSVQVHEEMAFELS